MNKILLLITITTLTACASMSQGSHQNVTISPENSNAGNLMLCTLSNEEGKWETVPNTPAKINRDGNDMTVDCSNETEIGKATVTPDFSYRYLMMDIILVDACILSCVIDGANNAFYTYPDTITVPMQRKPGIAAGMKN